MADLEDVWITSRQSIEIQRAQVAVRHNRPATKIQTMSTKKAVASAVTQNDKSVPSKRASLFSRRKSLAPATSFSTTQTGGNDMVHRVQTAPSPGRQSSEITAGIDVENLKSKFLSSIHHNKKAAPRMTSASPAASPTSRTHSTKPSSPRVTRQRAMSLGGAETANQISKPYGFQHVAKIEKSPRPDLTLSDLAQASIAAFNFHASKHHQTPKPQRRPPPLRPKRPEDHEIPTDLLSPRLGLPTLRQARSAEVVGSPSSKPLLLSNQDLPPQAPLTADLPQVSCNDSGPRSAGCKQVQFAQFLEQVQYDINVMDTVDMRRSHTISLPSPHATRALEQVAEESDGTATPRPSCGPSRTQASSHTTAAFHSTSFVNFDDLEPFLPRISLLPSIMLPRPISGGSDTLGDLSLRPFDMETELCDKQVSEVVDEFDFASSWDDDVVFAYSHGAEAHCDFDWQNASTYLEAMDDETSDSIVLQEVPIVRGRRHQYSSSWASTAGSDYGVSTHRSHLSRSTVPQRDSVPDLEDHVLSHSGSSSSLTVGTPQDQCGFLTSEPNIADSPASERRSGESFDYISPRLPPLGLKNNLDSDKLFDDLMAGFTFKQLHNATLPMLEAKTYNDPALRQRSVSDASRISQAPTSAPSERVISPSKTQDVRYSDVSVFTMRVCLESERDTEPTVQNLDEVASVEVAVGRENRKRSKTQSDWPQVITRGSLDLPLSARTSCESETRDYINVATAPVKTTCPITATKAVIRKQSASMHKKAASADGLPLSRHAFLTMNTRPSIPTRNLFAASPPLSNVPSGPVSRMRRMTAM